MILRNARCNDEGKKCCNYLELITFMLRRNKWISYHSKKNGGPIFISGNLEIIIWKVSLTLAWQNGISDTGVPTTDGWWRSWFCYNRFSPVTQARTENFILPVGNLFRSINSSSLSSHLFQSVTTVTRSRQSSMSVGPATSSSLQLI